MACPHTCHKIHLHLLRNKLGWIHPPWWLVGLNPSSTVAEGLKSVGRMHEGGVLGWGEGLFWEWAWRAILRVGMERKNGIGSGSYADLNLSLSACLSCACLITGKGGNWGYENCEQKRELCCQNKTAIIIMSFWTNRWQGHIWSMVASFVCSQRHLVLGQCEIHKAGLDRTLAWPSKASYVLIIHPISRAFRYPSPGKKKLGMWI